MVNQKTKVVLSISIFLTSFSVFSNDYIAPAMINIPAGEFMMGSIEGESTAQPMHKVELPNFRLSKYPITVAEFRKFVEDTGYVQESTCKDKLDNNWLSSPTTIGTANWDKNRYLKSEYQPVTCVSWQGANEYAKWLSEKNNVKYRLPTEQEWEYALKANTTSRYFWGDDPDMSQACLYGNFADQAGEYFASTQYGASYVGGIGYANCNDGEAYNSIVGIYRPNPFGLYDMVGNVMQMLGTCYYDGYEERTDDEMDVSKCEFIANRGETWHYPPQPHAERGRWKREGWTPGALIGFRLASDGHGNENYDSTAKFEQKLKQVQKEHLASRPQIPDAPKHVLLQKNKSNQYELSWLSSRDKRVTGYEIYQSKSEYSHFLFGYFKNHYEIMQTVDANVKSVIVDVPKTGGSFIVLSKTNDLTSLPSEAALKKEEKVLTIPGKLSTHESVSQHGVRFLYWEKSEKLPEEYRMYSQSHTLKQPTVSVTFRTNVKKAGWYHLNYRGNTFFTGEFFQVWKGNELIGKVEFDPDIDDQKSNRHRVYLEKGQQELQLTFKRQGFDMFGLSWVEFIAI